MKNLFIKLQSRIIHIGLILVLFLLFLYLFNDCFREFLVESKIDPNFIVGFFTVVALLLSLIQNSNDKRYTYNLKLVESIEDKGSAIIGKLLTIKHKSDTAFQTLKLYEQAFNSKVIYKEMNDVLNKADIEANIELIGAYIETYYPEQSSSWNTILDKLNFITSNLSNVILNYEENIDLIKKNTSFENKTLDHLEKIVYESEPINNEVYDLTLKMRDEIVMKMNKSKEELKKGFTFKF